MNTNLNEKINENLDAELDLEQLEDVSGGMIVVNQISLKCAQKVVRWFAKIAMK